MNQKKKQSIVAVVATVLTVTCVMSPVASVYATETDKTITQQNEATEINLNQKNTEVLIDKNNFPDEEFRNYVKQEFNKNDDDVLTTDEIAKVKTINVAGNPAIKDLKGIEHFTALERLNCSYTGITSLDVSKNPDLEYLDCSNTGITSLDASSNEALTKLYCYYNANLKKLTVKGATALTYLYCSDTGIQDLDVSGNPALTELDCSSTGITELDVSNNKALIYLDCHNTGIQNLDVSGNEALTYLYCSDTGITSLDVSGNPALTYLYCNDTGIQDLDVSKNKNLSSLYCNNTGITSLDVSNNTNLRWLSCAYTPLAYLNLGTNPNLIYSHMYDLKPVEIEVPVDNTFNIQDIFPGIIIGNIKAISGANYDKETGVVSDYKETKQIAYTYDCGASNTIDVTLNLTLRSVISIKEDLSKTYDGKAVSANPEVDKKGSSGAVSYKWERKKNANDWEDIASAPIDAGTYRVTAIVAGDEAYNGANSEPKEFTIALKSIENNQISISDINNDKDVENLILKDGDTELVKGTDYEVEKKQKGNKVDVIITFKGNYTGTITKSYTVNSVSAGDTTSVGLWSTILAFSAVLVVFLKRKKYKEQTEE